MAMRTITVEEFHAKLKAQGVASPMHAAFRCVMCGTVQSAASLVAAGAGSTMEEVERYLGFSCVGRWTEAGPWKKGEPAGRGCDWTLGGLFNFCDLEVVTPDGVRHSRFELATRDEAQALEKANTRTTGEAIDG